MSELGGGSVRPPCRRDDAEAILRRLREAGHVAYFAGGCVRDTLLGLEPKDWDVATDAPPQRVRQLFPRTQAVGAAFGVILVRQGESVVEVATFRTDVSYEDGRRPTAVKFTTAEEDAKRRDFTINGLFLDPVENKVIDYVGGQDDLKNRVLRAIGNAAERFAEDHLRLLRAVRFAARFGLTIEPATSFAMKTSAPALRRISQERIAEELRLMLVPRTRRDAWKMLWAYRLTHVIMRLLPEGDRAPDVLDERRSLMLHLNDERPLPFGLVLAAAVLCYRSVALGDREDVLLSLATKPEVQRAAGALRHALRISNDELAEMEGVLLALPVLLGDETPSVAKMKRALATPTAGSMIKLLDAIARSERFEQRVAWLRERFASMMQDDVAPNPLITGDDLTADGFQPGPMFKRVLNDVYDAQLEDRVKTREEALALARETFARG